MPLSIDQLAGGLAPVRDLVLADCPADPEMRESVSVWLFDDQGRFAFPRMGIEAEASRWHEHRVQGNFVFADGRAYNGAGMGAAHSPFDEDGTPGVLGAGPLRFRCVEPFRRWTMHWHGPARAGTVAQQIGGGFGAGEPVEIALDAELEMVTPAWVQENSDDVAASEIERENAAAMGLGYRFEHHFVATGRWSVGDEHYDFTGRGTRIHRQSVRSLAGFRGHCWLSAVFPNGDAFGALVYPPREGSDDAFSYNDAVVYQDGELLPARVVSAPFLHRIMPAGDPIRLVLETRRARTTIEGETALSTFRIGNPDMGGLNLQQGGVLFSWLGQRAYGMCERSMPADRTTIVGEMPA